MKEKTENNYYGSVTVQGASMQGIFVPAIQPYAVYAFVWEGSCRAIAQLIGTLVRSEVMDNGKQKYETNAVYRIPSRRMLDFEHCFIAEQTGEINCDPELIGFTGEKVSRDAVINVAKLFQSWDYDRMDLGRIIDGMTLAGLQVDMGEKGNMPEVEGSVEWLYVCGNRRSLYLTVSDRLAIGVMLQRWDGSKKECVEVADVLNDLYGQIKIWKKEGISFDRIRLTAKEDHTFDSEKENQMLSERQEKIDELIKLCKTYGEWDEKDEKFHLHSIIKCCTKLNASRCLYDDFKMAMQSVMWEDYSGVDRDLQWGIEMGLLSREGNIIEFTNVLMQMATWKIM